MAFNVAYAPGITALRRKRRRSWTVWNLMTGKTLSIAAALCLWEATADTYVDSDTRTEGILMAVALACLLACYAAEVRAPVDAGVPCPIGSITTRVHRSWCS